jgi:arylsulfatase
MNAPFRWGKQMASHLGGTRNPMAVAWPRRISPQRIPLAQFTHCTDIGPTVPEAVGLPEPTHVDGIEQEPMDGSSFAATFTDPGAAESHTVQYFEMFGGRALYQDGWWAASRPERIPWDFSPETVRPFGPEGDWDPDRDERWELYDLREDFSQARDVAAEHPDKVKELQEVWWREAERNRVLPMWAGASIMLGDLPPLPTITRFRFHGDVQNVQRGMVPRIFGRSYAIEADLVVPEGGAEGVIVANADFIGGFSLWVDADGLLHHSYSLLGVEQYRQVAERPLPTGEVRVTMLFEADEPQPGSGGEVRLLVGDQTVGSGRLPRTVPIAFSSYAGMDVGRDNGLVVDLDYEDRAPYAFTGTIRSVVFDLQPLAHEDEKALHEQALHHTVGQGAAG